MQTQQINYSTSIDFFFALGFVRSTWEKLSPSRALALHVTELSGGDFMSSDQLIDRNAIIN
jgi:hypothetical protein